MRGFVFRKDDVLMDQPFGVKAPCFENEGALHMTSGKFILSISGVQKKWEATEKRKKIAMIVAVCVVLTVLIVATLIAGHQANSMPYEYLLSESIGQPLEAVADNLKLSEDAFEQLQPGVYTIKEGCKLSGIPFAVALKFGEDAELIGFTYLAEYKAGVNKAASDLYKLAIDLRLKRLAQDALADTDLTMHGLKKQFADGEFALRVEHNSSPTYSESQVYKYLRQVEASGNWPGRVGEYVTVNAMVYEDIDLRYTPETETVYVQVAYTIEPDRSK